MIPKDAFQPAVRNGGFNFLEWNPPFISAPL